MFCAPLRVKSLLFTALLVFKAKAWGFWGLVFLVQDPWAGEPDVELTFHSSGRTSATVIILPICGSPT